VSNVWWLLLLAVIVLVGVLEQRNDRLRDACAYTKRIRRELQRERQRANPTFAFGRVWRFR
jgi:hypothetical protein